MEAFVYRWRNITTRQWYVGYHKGTPDDGYTCSSKIAKPLIESNIDQWQRKILRFGTKQEMCNLERRILKALKASRNPLSYNRNNGNGHTHTGRPKGSSKKISMNLILDLIKEKTGKTIYENIIEHYVECIIRKDYDVVRKYEKQIFLKHLGFDPDYFKNAK
jgi:hypothetical protein